MAGSIPHDCAVGSLDDTGSILEAARKLGIPDFEEHLWLGSVVETLYVMRYERALARSGPAAPAGSPDGMTVAEVGTQERIIYQPTAMFSTHFIKASCARPSSIPVANLQTCVSKGYGQRTTMSHMGLSHAS